MKNLSRLFAAFVLVLCTLGVLAGSANAGTSGTIIESNTGCRYSVSVGMIPGGGATVAITIRYWACSNPNIAHRGQMYAFGHKSGGPEVFDIGWISNTYSTGLTFSVSDARTVRLNCRVNETVTVDGHIQVVTYTGKVTNSSIVSASTKCVPLGLSGSW